MYNKKKSQFVPLSVMLTSDACWIVLLDIPGSLVLAHPAQQIHTKALLDRSLVRHVLLIQRVWKAVQAVYVRWDTLGLTETHASNALQESTRVWQA